MSAGLQRLREDREPFGPLIFASKRGVLHRAKPGPRIHPRCAGGRALRGALMSPEDATLWATGHEAALCRYPWCFRAVLRAAGIDPEVGHARRNVHRPRERYGRVLKHRAAPFEPVDGREHLGWFWCSCDRIVFEAQDGHNPDRRWWQHKATGYRGAA